MSATTTGAADRDRWPGPSRLRVLRDLPRLRRHRHGFLGYLTELAGEHGDVVRLPLRRRTYMLRDLDDIKHVLVTHAGNYHKSGGLVIGKHLLGEGLLSSEEPLHGRQRRVMQPMFHRRAIAGLAGMMAELTRRQTEGWRDGAEIDAFEEMMHLAISVVGMALCSVDLHREGRELGAAYEDAMRMMIRRQLGLELPLWIPLFGNLRYRRALAKIDRNNWRMIGERRALPEDERPDDLLSMLIAARFEDGEGMSDQQLRDEVNTMVLAGHETAANSLAWMLHLISRHPQVEERLHAEWEEVLGEREATVEDLPRLDYTAMVANETMRLYPPAWTLIRKAMAPDRLPGGLEVGAGEELLICQFVNHRNPAHFPDPERFDPERFAAGRREAIPKFAYFPFGHGPRYCIGEPLARMEQLVILSTLGRRFRFQAVDEQPIGLDPMATLRPKGGVRLRVRAR